VNYQGFRHVIRTKRDIIAIVLTCLCGAVSAGAVQVSGLVDAQRLASSSNKLILIEFQRVDCDHCEKAKRDADNEPLLKIALGTVVHLQVDVLTAQGRALAEQYHVGYTYPLFLLTDSLGREIKRWAGYTTADNFIEALNAATSDLTTIEAREERLRSNPNCADALYLASYYFETNRYAEAATTYHLVNTLPCNKVDYSFRVFQAVVEMAWRGQLPFDSAMAAADQVLAGRTAGSVEIGRTAQLLCRLARRTGDTDRIQKYLDTGMVVTGYKNDQANRDLHFEILADYALHLKHDTATALQLKVKNLGNGWENDPRRYFEYSEFCLERKIDLETAEAYARRAAGLASPGAFKARHLQVLADIVYARGRTEEALQLMQEALDNSPGNAWYEERMIEMKSGLNR